jgi:hypothetical protein
VGLDLTIVVISCGKMHFPIGLLNCGNLRYLGMKKYITTWSFVKGVVEITGPGYSINLFVLMPSSSSVNFKKKGSALQGS